MEAIEHAIQTMLAESWMPFAEEWAIHDFEGFGSYQLHEFTSVEVVSLLASGIAEHVLAFAAWAAHRGDAAEAAESFAESFVGEWESLSAYAAELLDDYGLEAVIDSIVPDCLRAYVEIDAQGLGRDLVLGGDLVALDSPSGSVWIFQGGRGQWLENALWNGRQDDAFLQRVG